MMRLIAAAVAYCSLAACATGYQSSGFTGGFDETALAPNVYRVSFRGNAYTSSERAADMALLRSADLTLQHGFKFFVLADASNTSRISAMTTPQTTTTTGSVTAYGNMATFNAQSNSYGGETVYLAKPRAANLVVMYGDKPSVAGMVFDAAFVCASLASKYKATCGAK